MNFIQEFKAEALKLVNAYKTKLAFKEFKLPTGETVGYQGDTPMMGMDFYIITEQGKLPAPDGTYQMEDGTVISTQKGKIIDVKPGSPEKPKADETQVAAPAAPAEPAKPQPTMITKITETVFNEEIKPFVEKMLISFNEKFESLTSENKILKTELEKQKELSKNMFSLIEKIADSPAELSPKKERAPASVQLRGIDKLMEEAKGLSKKVFKN